MANGFENIGTDFFNAYTSLLSSFPLAGQKFISFLFIVILVVIYAIFIWKFYQSISTKNLLELNLNQYNKSERPLFAKILAVTFYVLEYIIIFPALIFIWFSVFTLFLILLTENLPTETLLLISATVIAAIRLTSYYKKKLSEDLAKLVPFTLLAISLVNPDFFSIERIFNQFRELSMIFNDLLIYLVFIIIIEAILRSIDLLFSYFKIKEDVDEEGDTKEDKETIL